LENKIKGTAEMIYLGQIVNIRCLDTGKYILEFWTCPENETEFLAKIASGRLDTESLKQWLHSMSIEAEDNKFSMILISEEFERCMEVYSEYEFCDNLNPRLQRQWYTAWFADQLIDNLINTGLLSIWNFGKPILLDDQTNTNQMEQLNVKLNENEDKDPKDIPQTGVKDD
jgi:hypothetical protein